MSEALLLDSDQAAISCDSLFTDDIAPIHHTRSYSPFAHHAVPRDIYLPVNL